MSMLQPVIFGGLVLLSGAAIVLPRLLQDRRQRAAALMPIDLAGPAVDGPGDAFLRRLVAPQLEPGERITHLGAMVTNVPLTVTMRAIAVGAAVAGGHGIVGGLAMRGVLGVLTDRRLLLVQTRKGAFGALLEDGARFEVRRADVRSSTVRGPWRLESTTLRATLQHQRAKQFTANDVFWRDAPRVLAAWAAETRA